MKQTTLLAIIFLLTSCASSRKVDKTTVKTETQTEVKATSENQTRAEITSVTIDTSTTYEIEIIPVDNSKPIIINNVEYKNAKIKHSKRKNNISINKVEKVSKNEQKAVEIKYKQSNEVSKKQTSRFSLNFWWLLIPIACYLYYRRYGFKLPF